MPKKRTIVNVADLIPTEIPRQKTVTMKAGNFLHVETPLGIVNIRVGLHDMRGRAVDSIQVIPDEYQGEHKIVRRGYCNTRLVQLKKDK